MKKYYWLIAGFAVGIYSVLMAWVNLGLIVTDSSQIDQFDTLGIILVVLEYVVIFFVLGVIGDELAAAHKKKK